MPLTPRLKVSPPFFRRLTCKLYNKCIAAQRILVKKLIQNYYANKEVGCILAVRLNVVWKVNLEEFLDEEEVIYELIVDRVNKDDTNFLRVTFPTAPLIQLPAQETTYQTTGAHPHPTPKGVGPVSGTMPLIVDKRAKEKQTKEEVVQKILAPGGRKSSLRSSKRTAAETPPREEINKAIRPTGTSPMKDSKENDLESLRETMSLGLGTAKLDPSSKSSAKESRGGNNSIKASIAAVRANLFKGLMQYSAEPEEEFDSTAKSGKKKGKRAPWVHVAKAAATPLAKVTK